MKPLLILLCGAALCLGAERIGPPGAYPTADVGEWDATVTPANIGKTICVPGYTDLVRTGKTSKYPALTQSIKDAAYKRDGRQPDHKPRALSHCCEVDHYYGLNLGSANTLKAVWTEFWDGPFGAHAKDKVEDGLQDSVCYAYRPTKNTPMQLKEAQKCIADDWIECGIEHGFLKGKEYDALAVTLQKPLK